MIDNPLAGRFVADPEALVAEAELLGDLLGRREVQALGIAPDQVRSFGKAALVGGDAELGYAAATLHP